MAQNLNPTSPDFIKTAFWNADSVLPKKNELEEFIYRYELDLVAINETWLKPSTNFRIANFITYRADRTGDGGGTTILIKSNLRHFDEGKIEGLKHIEANCVVLQTNIGNIRVISAYARPGTRLPTKDLDILFKKSNTPTIVLGDLNSKHPAWNSRTSNQKGRTLLDYVWKEGIEVNSSPSPTFYNRSRPQDPPDWLDVSATKGITVNIVDSVDDLRSDHLPVLCEIPISCAKTSEKQLKSINWNNFPSTLNTIMGQIPKINTTEELDIAAVNLTEYIKEAIDINTIIHIRTTSNQLDLPKDLRELIKERNKLRKIYQRTRAASDNRNYIKLIKLSINTGGLHLLHSTNL